MEASKFSSYFATDSLPSWFPLHHFNPPLYNYSTGMKLVNLREPSLWAFVGMVCFNPVFWNSVAQNEYRNKTLTRALGSAKIGCYVLAATIFSLSLFRDSLYLNALRHQPQLEILANPALKAIASILFVGGQVVTLSSMWVLGTTGTYLGDYFNILMPHRVTGFPFNILSDPMYVGSSITHFGTALWYQSPLGVLLSGFVWAVYMAALRFEGPFTDMIYSSAHKRDSGTAPDTPTRKSSRLAQKSSVGNLKEEETGATPRRTRTSALVKEETGSGGEGSPMRMTRSRSKGRGLGSDVE